MAGQQENLRKWFVEGWSAEKTSGGHLKLTHPQASAPIYCASTPSDWRAVLNTEALMRRALLHTVVIDNQLSDDHSNDIVKKSQVDKKKPKRAFVTDFRMPQRLPPTHAFGSNRRDNQEILDGSDISKFVDPMEVILAWGYAYIRLRIDGKEPALIRVLRERYKRDQQFRDDLICAFRRSTPKEFNDLRYSLRNNTFGNDASAPTFLPVITNVSVPLQAKNPPEEVAPEIVPVETFDFEGIILKLQQDLRIERQRCVNLEKEIADLRLKRSTAEAARNDAFLALSEIKIERRELSRSLREVSQQLELANRIIEENKKKAVDQVIVVTEPHPTVVEKVLLADAVTPPPSDIIPRKAVRPKAAQTIRKTIGERVRELRYQRGWTQSELADRLYVSGALISTWETGKVMPSADWVKRIARAFRITEEKFING